MLEFFFLNKIKANGNNPNKCKFDLNMHQKVFDPMTSKNIVCMTNLPSFL